MRGHKAALLKKEIPFYIMLIPGIIVVFIYGYIPLGGIVMAFQNFMPALGVFKSPWVGWDNFEYALSMPDTMQVLYNTLFIALMKIAAGLVTPIAVSLMLNEVKQRGVKRVIQTIIYLPHFLSWVILSGVLIDILSPSEGIVGQIFQLFSMKPVFFLGDENWFPYTMVISDVWKEFGFGTVIYLAALTSIDPELYEAALMDGASRWKRTLHVTLPGIMPIVVLMTVLALGNVLNAGFDQIYNMISAQVYSTGDIIDTMVYRMGLRQVQYSVATAVGLFKSVISFTLISISYYLAYKLVDYRIF
ncbi:MAG: ABC transporter permease subunit [Clostridiales bacterium]|jgi:putative aldouronate transport system permease protein|nr:ABC transporter permease subunit [Clostridiales bacterium]